MIHFVRPMVGGGGGEDDFFVALNCCLFDAGCAMFAVQC